jgi:hypothetical protein
MHFKKCRTKLFDYWAISIIFAPLIQTGWSGYPARVAKLVDALCSGRSIRKVVLVRIQSRAHQ